MFRVSKVLRTERRKLDFESRLGMPLFKDCGKYFAGSGLHHGDGGGDYKIKAISVLYGLIV